MGLFDRIAGAVGGQLGSGGAGPLVEAFGSHAGGEPGMAGIVSGFEQAGLGHLVQSWVGDGENLPVSPEQIRAVLGNEQVEAMAQRYGIDTNALLQQLSEHLPKAVSEAAPDGGTPG